MQINKDQQLGMSTSTASNRLKKSLLYSLVVRLDLHYCFQCGSTIDTLEELSIEHKQPWLGSDDPKKLFFDLENIAFSHLICNVAARRKKNQKYFTEDDRLAADRRINAASKRKSYTPEARHKKYLEKGY